MGAARLSKTKLLLLVVVLTSLLSSRSLGQTAEKQEELFKAAKAYARTIAADDEALYERALIQALEMAASMKQQAVAKRLEEEILKFQREIDERLQILRAMQAARPVAPFVEVSPVERSLPTTPSILQPADSEDFAPRLDVFLTDAATRSAVPLNTASLRELGLTPYYEDPTWQKNMGKLLEEREGDVQPRIFNPHDDESRGVMDLRDCVSIGGPGSPCSCTGTVIEDTIVLTAAHCVPCSRSRIYVGWNANNPSTGELYKIRRVIPHPQYNSSTQANDLAIVVLEQPLPPPATSRIRRRVRATTAQITGATSFTAVGFGKTDQGNFGIKLEAPIALRKFFNKEFQAGGSGFDSCQGDSGGPAYVLGPDGTFLLAGVTSRGGRCSTGGIYVRVDAYKDWIEQTIASSRSAPQAEGQKSSPE